MARYKLSEFNFDKFWSFFGKKNKPKPIDYVIANDPELKRLDAELQDLATGFKPHLLKVKKEDPKIWDLLVKGGLVPKDYK